VKEFRHDEIVLVADLQIELVLLRATDAGINQFPRLPDSVSSLARVVSRP
jgi:hypothetical protein